MKEPLRPPGGRRKRLITAVTTLAATVILAACGGGGGSAAPEATATLAGDPIVVGMICSCSGPQAATLGRDGDVAQAWAKWVNANGGINGHPVKMIVKDDGANPANALQGVKELVEQEHIIALVGEASNVDAQFASYMQQKGVPVVGGLSFEAPFLTNPNFYPSGSPVPVLLYGAIKAAKDAGKKKFGILYCSESPACAQLGPMGTAIANMVGIAFYSAPVSATAPSYAAPCLAAKDAGVDALEVAQNPPTVVKIHEACAQQGYSPRPFNNSSIGPIYLSSTALNGAFVASPNATYTDPSAKSVKQFLDVLDKYLPGLRKSDEFSSSTEHTWAGGMLFLAAAKAAKLTPTSTPADVKKGLYMLKNETLGGLAPPLNFTEGKPAFPNCAFPVTIDKGTFKTPSGSSLICLSDADTASLKQLLKLPA